MPNTESLVPRMEVFSWNTSTELDVVLGVFDVSQLLFPPGTNNILMLIGTILKFTLNIYAGLRENNAKEPT